MSDNSNASEQSAREQQAFAIARLYSQRAIVLLLNATDDEWQNLATVAGQRKPSEETRARVIEILRGWR